MLAGVYDPLVCELFDLIALPLLGPAEAYCPKGESTDQHANSANPIQNPTGPQCRLQQDICPQEDDDERQKQ